MKIIFYCLSTNKIKFHCLFVQARGYLPFMFLCYILAEIHIKSLT